VSEGVILLLIGAPDGELRTAAQIARDHGAQVAMADGVAEGAAWLRAATAGLVMIDVMADVPAFMDRLRTERIRVPVVACGIDAPADRAVAAIRAGATDYVPLPPDRALIAAALACAAVRPAPVLVGADEALSRALRFGLAMAPSRVPVLIVGEPGTGKETAARSIHAASGRAGGFLAVECCGVAAEIVESELFGHAAGTFPGAAARRAGKVEQAAGGTLFLRDIDCLSAAAQARLMAMLREAAEVRLIAATAADLSARVAGGTFRADLLARLAIAELHLPPLRERVADLPALVTHLAERLARQHDRPARQVDAAALTLLAAHGWPGNVRELEDVMHRALVLARGPAITPDDIVLADGSRIAPSAPATSALPGEAAVGPLVGRTVEEVERALILRTLERCRGNRTSASGILGISVRTMRNKLKAFVEAGIPVVPAA